MSTRLPAVLNSSFAMVSELHPIDCSVRLNIEPISQSEMLVLDSEAPDVRGWVEVFTPHGTAGIFRVSVRESSYVEGQVRLSLDHGICTLMDDLAPEGASNGTTLYYSGTPKQVLTQILSKQSHTYWQAGSAPNTGSVKIDVEWENLLDLLTKLMDELPGYMLTFDQTTSPWTVGIAARPSTVSAEGRLSRNVTSAKITLDDSDMCTRVYCSALPEPHYMTSTASSTYGIIAQKINAADGATEQEAENACDAYLAIHDHPAVSAEIDAVELCELTGDSFDELAIGKLYRLAIPDYGLVQEECITSLYYSSVYDNPMGVQITLASDAKDLTSHLSKMQKAVKSAGRGAAKAEEKADVAADGYHRYEHFKEETDQKFSLLYSEDEWDAAYAAGERILTHYDTEFTQTARKLSLIASEDIYNSASAANPLVGQLRANLEVTARKISSTVSATGLVLDANGNPVLDANGNYTYNGSNNSLDSQIVQRAGQIQTLITKTGINDLGNAETLYSKINQTYNSFSVLIDSNTGAVSPASLILAINGDGTSSAAIKATKIDLQGYVTADELDAEAARFDNLISGRTVATTLSASSMQTSSLYYNTGSGYQLFNAKTIQMQKNSNYIQGIYLGLSSQSTLDLTHAHKVTVSSTGVLTLGTACDVGDDAANFNIADTQYFRDAVSAAQTAGWDLAYGKLAPPAQGTSASMTVGIPGSTYNHTSSYSFTVSTDSSYAYIKDALGQTVARCGNSGGGGSSAVDSISMNGDASDASTASLVMLKVPVAAYDADGEELKNGHVYPIVPTSIYEPTLAKVGNSWRSTSDGTASNTGNYVAVKIKATTAGELGSAEDTYVNYIGSYLNTAKTDGWNLARGKVVLPPVVTTNSTRLSIGIPSTTYNEASSANFTLSVDGSYAYIKNNNSEVVARCSNVYGRRTWGYVEDNTGSFYLAGQPVTAYAAGTTGTYYRLNSGDNNHLKLSHLGDVTLHGTTYDCWYVNNDGGHDYYWASSVSLTLQGAEGNYNRSAGVNKRLKGKYVYPET